MDKVIGGDMNVEGEKTEEQRQAEIMAALMGNPNPNPEIRDARLAQIEQRQVNAIVRRQLRKDAREAIIRDTLNSQGNIAGLASAMNQIKPAKSKQYNMDKYVLDSQLDSIYQAASPETKTQMSKYVTVIGGHVYKRKIVPKELDWSEKIQKMDPYLGSQQEVQGFWDNLGHSNVLNVEAATIAPVFQSLRNHTFFYKNKLSGINDKGRLVRSLKALIIGTGLLKPGSREYSKFMSHPYIQYIKAKIKIQNLEKILENWSEEKSKLYWAQTSDEQKVKNAIAKIKRTGNGLPMASNREEWQNAYEQKMKSNASKIWIRVNKSINEQANNAFGKITWDAAKYSSYKKPPKKYEALADIFSQ